METDAPAPVVGAPRAWLLIAAAAVVALFLVWWTGSAKSAAPAATPSKPRVLAKDNAEPVGPADLTVRLGALEQPRPAAEGGNRNPFRFYEPPPPPPPAPAATVPRQPGPPQLEGPPVPAGPPPPPPIPLKFIGVMEVPGMGKLAAFSDCRTTLHGREGEIIDGRYRLVRIGVESAVMEYVDGRGRTTIRLSGQECVVK